VALAKEAKMLLLLIAQLLTGFTVLLQELKAGNGAPGQLVSKFSEA
jgi:hypothetical protein